MTNEAFSLDNVRIHHDKIDDTIKLISAEGTIISVYPGTELDKSIRDFAKAQATPKPALPSGLPESAFVHYDADAENYRKTLAQEWGHACGMLAAGNGYDSNHKTYFYNPLLSNEYPASKDACPVGIDDTKSVVSVNVFDGVKPNLFVSGLRNANHIANSVRKYAANVYGENCETYTYKATTLPELSYKETVRYDKFELLKTLRYFDDFNDYKARENNQHYLIVIGDVDSLVLESEYDAKHQRVEKAVRAEILSLISSITERQNNDGLEGMAQSYIHFLFQSKTPTMSHLGLAQDSEVIHFGTTCDNIKTRSFTREIFGLDARTLKGWKEKDAVLTTEAGPKLFRAFGSMA